MKDFCKEKADGVSAFPDAARSILFWKAKLTGAAGTPYAGQVYELQLEFPEDYPMRPPTVQFVTQIFHPNGSMLLLLFFFPLFNLVCSVGGEGRHLPGHFAGQVVVCVQWCVSFQTLCVSDGGSTVRSVLLSVLSLLGDPNNASPLNPQAAALWDDAAGFKAQVDAVFAKSVKQ